jgi:ABC-type protease/lipase transport system fused ATPase/permease subunit
MLSIAVLGAFAVMEVMEWARGEVLHDAGRALDQ